MELTELLNHIDTATLTPENIAQFHVEQQCNVTFANLPPVRREFIEWSKP